MPWSRWHCPPPMRHLAEAVCLKAIAIANASLAEGLDEGAAIRIAIARAERRAAARGLPIRDDR
ncbi:MAG: hypothetical protein JNL87_19935 [Burkholderiaceae bacterium]|nr:hypothetical protein [Burkholderiaceae bacterium]